MNDLLRSFRRYRKFHAVRSPPLATPPKGTQGAPRPALAAFFAESVTSYNYDHAALLSEADQDSPRDSRT